MSAMKVQTNAVKFIGDSQDRVGGYLVMWGNPEMRDLYGEYFTPNTELGLDWYPERPLLYHHGLDGTLRAALIGKIDVMKTDITGLWIEAQLDMRNEYVEAVQQLVADGVLGMSSGSLPHLVEVSMDGKIISWPIIEGSLTPTPAEPRTNATLLPNVQGASIYEINADATRAAYKSADLALPDILELDGGNETPATEQDGGSDTDAQETTAQKAVDTTEPNDNGGEIMPDNITEAPDIAQVVQEQVAAALAAKEEQARQDALAAKAALADERAARIAELENALAAKAADNGDDEPAKRLPGAKGVQKPDGIVPPHKQGSPTIKVASSFDKLSAMDMAHGYMMMRAGKGFKGVSERYANAMAEKVGQSGLLATAIKADELSHSTQTGYGDEWVPDLWSAELWRQAREDNEILPLFRSIEMPSNPYELPVEGADPTVYYVSETKGEADLTLSGSGNPIPDSKIASDKATLAAKKLALRVGFSAELAEDSIVPVLAMYREQALRALSDAIDSVLLNGDTETGATGNINSDDGAPTGNEKYLAFDGLRKLGLVTTTANAIAASGAPTLALLRQTRFTMANKYSLKPNSIAWIVDGSTYAKLLSLDEFTTMDKMGTQATVLTGQVGNIDMAPVISTSNMPLTMADGKVDASGNTKGQAVCVYRPGWIVGYRRRIAVSMDYLPYYDAYQMTATVRLAFARIDADVAAVLYNITV